LISRTALVSSAMLLYCLYSKVGLFAGGCSAAPAHSAKDAITPAQTAAHRSEHWRENRMP
jgi:hypothetical protein